MHLQKDLNSNFTLSEGFKTFCRSAVQDTGLYKTIQNNTSHRTKHGYTGLNKTKDYTRLYWTIHITLHNYTQIYKTEDNTRLYRTIQYTGFYGTM